MHVGEVKKKPGLMPWMPLETESCVRGERGERGGEMTRRMTREGNDGRCKKERDWSSMERSKLAVVQYDSTHEKIKEVPSRI